MCIRDRILAVPAFFARCGKSVSILRLQNYPIAIGLANAKLCLLYTSDAADDLLCVDLGGRRIIKKKKKLHQFYYVMSIQLHIK